MTRTPRNLRTAGFALVELLVVIGVIGLLLGLILPAVQKARSAAERTKCLGNLRQIGVALHLYHEAHGRLPGRMPTFGSSGQPDGVVNWMALILPQMEQEPLWAKTLEACRLAPVFPALNNPPHVGYSTVIPGYVCPADGRLLGALTDRNGDTAAYTSYIGVAGAVNNDGVMKFPSIRFREITDGLSNTLMLGERPPPENLRAGRWYPFGAYFAGRPGDPYGPDWGMHVQQGLFPGEPCNILRGFGPGRIDNPCDRYHFWSLHSGGANFLFADGHGLFLTYAADNTLAELASRAGGEVARLPE